MRIQTTLVLLALVSLIAGCSSATAPPAHQHAGHSHGPHPETGPHNGHLIELGEEAYHLEWTHDDESGEVTVYILDGEAKEVVPLASETISILSAVEDETEGKQTTEFKLAAVEPSGEPPMASQFSLKDPALLMSINMAGEGSEVTVPLMIEGKEYTATFEKHDDHAGHNH